MPDGILKFRFCCSFFFLFCPFLPFHGQVHWTMSKQPSHERLALPQLGVPSGIPPLRWSLPFWVSASPPGCLPEEKRTPPGRGARKPPRVRRVLPCQVARKYRQGVPAVLLPFFREDIHRFPIRVRAVSPSGSKPRDPWGSSWPRLGPSRGESGPCAKRLKRRESHPRLSTWISKSMWVVRIMTSEKLVRIHCACAK